jgi:hypothetical protein
MNGLRKVPKWCISLGGAGFYALWMAVLAKAGGPNWIMVPNDLTYTYLFNGLNILTGHPLGTLIHPATTVSFFFALCTWLIHGIVGSGELVRDVIDNAEFYMRSINSIIVALNTVGVFVLGQMIYAGTRHLSLILVGQGAFILCPAVFLSFNSFGSPESFETFFLVLLTGMTIATLKRGLPDWRLRLTYVGLAALVAGAAIGSKFTSFPLILLPLLIIPTLKWKAAFLILVAISTALFVSPIFLTPENWQRFLDNIHGIASNAAIEREAVIADSFISKLAIQAHGLFGEMRLFILVLCIEVACCLLLPAFGAVRRANLANAYRVYCAFVLTAAAMVGFTLIRPKPIYLGPYTVILGGGLVLLVYMADRYLTGLADAGSVLRRFPKIAAGTIVTLYLSVGIFELIDSSLGIPLLVQIRDDAFAINGVAFPIQTNQAVVTAIQASNLYTAFDHANQYSNFAHVQATATITPPNRYNYLFDGATVTDNYGLRFSLRNLLTRYRKVYFWSTNPNFQRGGWRIPPDAVMQNLFKGLMETLVEVDAVAIPNAYDPTRSADENAANGWSDSDCGFGCRSLNVCFGDLRDEIVTHYE